MIPIISAQIILTRVCSHVMGERNVIYRMGRLHEKAKKSLKRDHTECAIGI